MVKTHRCSTTALIVCLAVAQWRGTLAASEQPPSSSTPPSPAVVNVVAVEQDPSPAIAGAADVTDEQLPGAKESPRPVEGPRLKLPDEIFHAASPAAAGGHVWPGTSTFFAGEPASFSQRGYGRRGRGGRNDAARAAVVLGAVAAIAGTSVLVYANRPECSGNARPGGCGYGTKVVGTAVLSGGIVALVVGALTWR